MTTQTKKSSITVNELNNILTDTLAKVAEPKTQPLDKTDKTAFILNLLSRSEGATLKEMAEALGWKENSIRGAMSLYAKRHKKTITSEKKDGIRFYKLAPST